MRCAQDLPWNREQCARCALPLAHAAECCARCLKRPPAFDRVLAPLQYAYPLDALITRFKFNHDLAAGNLLADLMIDAISHSATRLPDLPLPDLIVPDLIVPVPLHRHRLRERGFNQSLELAKRIARAVGREINREALQRTRATEVQSGLDAKTRRHNVRGAFAASPEIVRGKSIVLIDDVVTTAATAHECASILKQAGARAVSVWAVARAPERP